MELRELKGVHEASEVLILLCEIRMSTKDKERLEANISSATGKAVIVLGPEITKIIGI